MESKGNRSTNLALDSIEELRYIFKWSLGNIKYKQGDLVLVWGWAVHSYIPWKYSLDMDIIAKSRFKTALQSHLHQQRNYSKEKVPEGNTIFLKRSNSGDIYIDFLPKRDRFHGKNEMLDLTRLNFKKEARSVSYLSKREISVIVPEVSMLMILKLKAAWDRNHDLQSDNYPDKDRLLEKLEKDCGDIISLIKCNAFSNPNLELISYTFSKFGFLRKFMEEGIIEKFSSSNEMQEKEGADLIRKLLSLV